MRQRLCAGLAALTVASALAAAPATAAGAPGVREGAGYAVPLYGDLLRVWDAPDDDPYAPGHRGIDVGAPAGTPVAASAEGVVVFAGSVAGNRTVSLDHSDGVRTSYSYLGSVAVARGQRVARGGTVGTVGAGHPSSGLPPHVHLSARRDGVYFDPLGLYVGSGYSDLVELTG